MKNKPQKALAVLLVLILLLGIAVPSVAAGHSFADVPDGRWYTEAVQFVYEHNIMGGVGDNQFNPQGNLTRSAVTALLFRVHHGRMANAQDERSNNFTDVGNASWYAPYVAWAFNNDIVLGTSATMFNPHGNITRQEFAAMVYRYAMYMTDLYDENMTLPQWLQFTDRWDIEAWAHSALRWMNFHGIVTGSTATTINPTRRVTRAEAAIMMVRFVERLAHPQTPLPPLAPLCPGLEMRIREDFAARRPGFTPEAVRIDGYFGTYNGKVAVMICTGGAAGVVWEQEVAGFVFIYHDGRQIQIWYNGDFFFLPQAYEQGLITAEDVGNISYRYANRFSRLY